MPCLGVMPVVWRAPDLRQILCCLATVFFVGELRWSEQATKVCRCIMYSGNKAFQCGFFGWRCGRLQLYLLLRRGADMKLRGTTLVGGKLRKTQGGVGAEGFAIGSSPTMVRSTIGLVSRLAATPGAGILAFCVQPPDGRLYCDCSSALHVFLFPSGRFPGEEDDGRRPSPSMGGDHGPDRFSFSIFRVLDAYLRDYVVIVTCSRVLSVIWLVPALF